MKAGVIASVKVRYKTVQMERTEDQIDILSVMGALKRIWEELPENIFKQCWIHTKVIPAFDAVSCGYIANETMEPRRDSLQDQITARVPVRARMAIENFINRPGRTPYKCLKLNSFCLRTYNGTMVRVIVINHTQNSLRRLYPLTRAAEDYRLRREFLLVILLPTTALRYLSQVRMPLEYTKLLLMLARAQ